MTAKNYEVPKGLPKKTQSLCPECKRIIEATIYDDGGKVYIKKTCSEHGDFKDVYWSDTEMFLKAEEYAYDGVGLVNSKDPKKASKVVIKIADEDVELKTCTALANIDLTNRCNMNCPICFANANQAGFVYEPDYDTIVKMLEMLRAEGPIKCTAVQFSGGEPTIYPRFIDVIKAAKKLNFAQIQVATNGVEFAKDFDLLKGAKDAGMNTIYLSFDGISDDIYMQARNRKMFGVKLKLFENLRKLEKPPSVVLVPTVVKGLNDHQVGDIVKFAFDNCDLVRAVNFQPVAFTGRMEHEELAKGRFTLPDLVKAVGAQTGYTEKDDWYPVPVVAPISRLASLLLNENKVTFTTHPHCGIATYLFKDETGRVTPIPRFIKVKELTEGFMKISDKLEHSWFRRYYAFKALKLLNRCVIDENVPEGLSKKKFVSLMKSIMSKKSKTTLAKFSWSMMMISGMHFQDNYNYDIERIRRCGVHYATPDMRVIPFCAYNGGPEYRAEVEKEFSVPLAEWREKHGDKYC